MFCTLIAFPPNNKYMAVVVKTNGIPVWLVGAPPILVYFSGDGDVHRTYDLGFDPCPHDVYE